jgi:hypothetical protein
MKKELEDLKKAIMAVKIELQAEAPKDIWEGPSTRLINFVRWEKRPSEIHKFKTLLKAKERAKLILPAPVVEFDVAKLKTAQRCVIKKKLKSMVRDPDIAASKQPHKHYGMIYGIVARCRRGYFIYDSNHRACINLLAGRKHVAHLIDLRDIDNIVKRLKTRKSPNVRASHSKSNRKRQVDSKSRAKSNG